MEPGEVRRPTDVAGAATAYFGLSAAVMAVSVGGYWWLQHLPFWHFHTRTAVCWEGASACMTVCDFDPFDHFGRFSHMRKLHPNERGWNTSHAGASASPLIICGYVFALTAVFGQGLCLVCRRVKRGGSLAGKHRRGRVVRTGGEIVVKSQLSLHAISSATCGLKHPLHKSPMKFQQAKGLLSSESSGDGAGEGGR